MPQPNNITTFVRHQPFWRIALAVVVIAAAALFWFKRGAGSAQDAPTFAARRGPLEIIVTEGGSIQALEAQEIKCEVRVGYQGAKILRIVEEGYLVTEEDVKNGKVLVELDSSELQKQIVQQEIQYQSALATLTDAEQNYEIQLGQNDSDLKAAEQKVRFARMDFDKFLGDKVTEQIVRELGLDRYLAEATTNDVTDTANAEVAVHRSPSAATPVMPVDGTAVLANLPNAGELVALAGAVVPRDGTALPPADLPVVTPPQSGQGAPAPQPEPLRSTRTFRIDFTKYADIDLLGDGEAMQRLRKLEDDLRVAEKELQQAATTLEGTKRLFEKGFVPRTEVTRDEIAYESARLKVQTAQTAQALFLKYEFIKLAEEALSKYVEAVRELDKARRVAVSKLAQARARLNSARGQYEIQERQLKDLQDQLEKCTMRAMKPGLVVYGANRDDGVIYASQEPIREGATVRERQAIITIPDMTRMAVSVKVHESYIKKVKKGQKARITVDAFPDQMLTGEIIKVGVLPDSQNRWLNPDMKVYLTTVAIDGTHEWIKPGMSAKVEILVNRLEDAIYVPVQAVVPEEGKHVCYVMNGLKPERREVQTGEFNDNFIEIKSGIREGERVLLRLPETLGPGGSGLEMPAEEAPLPVPEPAPAIPTTTARR
ncbi:MAG TPA: HlyD family efflux transporter periplasmic adaptor subunit [Verrucomicrobia bacterium]|nr:HlyD family efflux transporter periplasmic adaptor subunit [Verrucomicrobiota bacterium]HOB31438.1 efflux RND transporter periplasmic adaptor subunit [Verrucomicrobiota bacterium]HOP97336.1 efflux RND transporter periplasmic adaptor subunit [Verrucomicrobiota bacterium]HPU54817.1 efflux RND transporter periplasmic adaptor subunit [Verrucomicrobiota bacterium]